MQRQSSQNKNKSGKLHLHGYMNDDQYKDSPAFIKTMVIKFLDDEESIILVRPVVVIIVIH